MAEATEKFPSTNGILQHLYLNYSPTQGKENEQIHPFNANGLHLAQTRLNFINIVEINSHSSVVKSNCDLCRLSYSLDKSSKSSREKR